MPKQPEPFVLSLREKPGPTFGNKPDFELLLNGVVEGEIYFNMTGYRGSIPVPQGGYFDPGEVSITAFRREIRLINEEAKR